MQASDQDQRRAALDPSKSFIVEAPAGSGKTELLIQRYLRLLALVERPEQIVAITFTRKAAAEMRQRVVATLEAAAAGSESVPPHRLRSLDLARQVLAHAQRAGWTLADQPRRLRITTIDALSTSLAQRLPVPASGIGGLAVTDKAGRLYLLAARRVTEGLAEDSDFGAALRRLLEGADNSLARLDRWLAGVLPQRDGWLAELADAGTDALADKIAANIERLRSRRLAALRSLVSPEIEAGLLALLAGMPDADQGSEPAEAAGPEAAVADDGAVLAAWVQAASLFLKRDGDWRRRLTSADGFPAGDKERRQALDSLLEVLHGTRGMRESLAELGAVPEPLAAGSQRELLQALRLVLPRLLAELRVLFEEHGVVDHTELALAAERALGTVDEPSELLLALDRRIEHILVDEFQDTSHLQWRLFEKLTAGWAEGDGRTLFLVGDPMQSIYRFRDADLSLFLKAKRHGLGGLALDPIALRENYRSAEEVVDWVNSTFAHVFPETPAPDASMPPYRPAIATHKRSESAGVELHVFRADDNVAETTELVRIVGAELDRDPLRSIGILVRSRTHLKGLREALADAGIPAHAVEIDSLSDTQIGQDLMALTAALLHPGDRLSWLGVLRSPWCGLCWADLLGLCADRRRTVWDCMSDDAALDRLSEDGRLRVKWLHARLSHGLELRSTRSLARWIRDCWLLLDGPGTLTDQRELQLAEQFFAGLESLARLGDIDDTASLRRQFSEPAAGTESAAESGVEIMTMHRAKGLEFDTVLLPSLGRLARGSNDNLLYLQSINLGNDERISLLAAASRQPDALRDYLRALDRRHEDEERGRLLYVAATRARERLHLLGSVDLRSGKPRAGSLLATLWPCLDPSPEIIDGPADPARAEVTLVHRKYRRPEAPLDLPEPPVAVSDLAPAVVVRPEFQWVNPASVQVGTLIHRELQRLADRAAQAGTAVPPRIELDRYRHALELLGVEREDLDAASRRVGEALEKVWADPTGRWILEPRAEAWSELRLTIRGEDRLEHVQLDRSFVDDEGTRWIIDYKTGRHLGGDPEGFLDSEVERYRSQLERYALVLGETETRPIRVGLYFPLMARLRDWTPSPGALAD
jgi:ATP-dependent exoDNAse (exonuclease V) beta subunit